MNIINEDALKALIREVVAQELVKKDVRSQPLDSPVSSSAQTPPADS
ncbi:hypothetical protein GW889_02755, partial [Candidatus Berkelbacteria bacterium]|nr:hypothetical protein [Candidatus Berkelbacteria bacterium]